MVLRFYSGSRGVAGYTVAFSIKKYLLWKYPKNLFARISMAQVCFRK